MEDFDKVIELGIENTNIPSETIELIPASKYEEFDICTNEPNCMCSKCSNKVTLSYSCTGLGDLGGILTKQLGPTEYDVELNILGSNHYKDNGKPISEYLIDISGDDVEKVTKNLTNKGWRMYSSLEFGLIQTYDDELCSIPSEMIDMSLIRNTFPSLKIKVGNEFKYVRFKDILKHETRKLNNG